MLSVPTVPTPAEVLSPTESEFFVAEQTVQKIMHVVVDEYDPLGCAILIRLDELPLASIEDELRRKRVLDRVLKGLARAGWWTRLEFTKASRYDKPALEGLYIRRAGSRPQEEHIA